MTLEAGWIAEVTGGELHGDSVEVTGVETDSRECHDGSLYVARIGETSDGHDFAAQAIAAGARCLLVERLLPLPVTQIVVPESTLALGKLAKAHLARLRSRTQVTVVGITGSAGKTTAKDLLGQVLSSQAPTVYPRLSFNNEVGCPLTILRATEDTRYLVLEMGASGIGHLRYLTDIAPVDVACVLMVGSAHLGGFGSLEAIQEAKAELVEGLLRGGIAVLNADDSAVRAMSDKVPPGCSLRWFSRGDAQNIQMTNQGIEFSYQGTEISVPLVGDHHVMNALAALACAQAVGIATEDAGAAMSHAVVLSPHRMVLHQGISFGAASDLLLIDDSYNANPDSIRAALRATNEYHRGRTIMVFGEMLELGADSAQIHEEVLSEVFESGVAKVIAVGAGLSDVGESWAQQGRLAWCASSSDATMMLKEIVETGDTILVKGSNGSGVWNVADAMTESAS